ncbi:MAG: ATP-binding protein [Bacteroidota bacterium]
MAHYIENRILEGEHQQQDFKFRIDDSRKIARSLVAFANTDGGRLLIGVKDNGRIAGVRSEEEYYMAEAAAQLYAKPEIPFESRLWEVQGKQVLEVIIPKSPLKPHFAEQDDGRWRAYIRKADQNLMANRVLLGVWKQQGRKKGANVQYSETEQTLFRYLREHDAISFGKFCRLAGIHRFAAEKILIKLISWEVLELDLTDKGALYRFRDNLLQPSD